MIARMRVAVLPLALATIVPSASRPARQIEWRGLAADRIPAEHVTVWLPPGHDQAKAHRYPVRYSWDGEPA